MFQQNAGDSTALELPNLSSELLLEQLIDNQADLETTEGPGVSVASAASMPAVSNMLGSVGGPSA